MAKKFVVNQDQMTLGASMVGDIYTNISQELMLRMIRRIKKRGTADLQENPYLWQLEKLNDMHMLNEQNIQYVVEQTGVAREIIDNVIKHEGLKVYQDTSEQLAEQLRKRTPQYNGVQEMLQKYVDQTFLDLDNLVNQTLLTTSLGENSAMQVYKSIIEQSVAEVTTGLRTADDAISRTVNKWLSAGIPSAFIDKGGHTWSIERYANTVMTSTTYRVYNEMRTSSAKELGVNTFHMSSHAASRPACAPIQGHIVTMDKQGFESGDKSIGYVTSLWSHGYGEPGGTLGINCHHVLTPFVIGVNELPDEDIPKPEDAIENGKKQALQRGYERDIRDAKYKIEAAKALNDDVMQQRYKNILNNKRAGLRQLLNDNDFLKRDYAREKIYKNTKRIQAIKDAETSKIGNEFKKVEATLKQYSPSLDDYKDARSNVKVYNSLMEDVKSVNYMRHSSRETSDPKIREKGIDIYFSLKRDGYTASGHSAVRMADRMTRKNGQLNYNYQTIVNVLRQQPNYIDPNNGRFIRYYDKITIVTEKSGRIVTSMKQKRPSKKWEAL